MGLLSWLFSTPAEKPDTVEAAPATGRSLADIGQNGSVADINKEMEIFGSLYGGAPQALIQGALLALRDGKPENMQAVITGNQGWENRASTIVHGIALGMTAAETKAVIGYLSAEKQQYLLDYSVIYCARKNFMENDEAVVFPVLKEAGANFTATNNYALQTAAEFGRIWAADFIMKNGGDFESAIADAKAANDKRTAEALLVMQVKHESGELTKEASAPKLQATPPKPFFNLKK